MRCLALGVNRASTVKKCRRKECGGRHLFAQTDAGGPMGQVMGDDLDGRPGGVGSEAGRWLMVECHAVPQARIAFSILAWR